MDIKIKQIESDLIQWNKQVLIVNSLLNNLNEEFKKIYDDIQEMKRGGK